jgi:hypothetical protein
LKVGDSRQGEGAVALALLALAAFVIWSGLRMPAGTVALPGPGFFPVALGVLLALVALAVLARAVLAKATGGPVALGHRDVAVAIVSLMLAAALFEPLGALLTTAGFVALSVACYARLAWWRAALWGIVAALAVWLFFIRLLGLQLPRGVLDATGLV